MTTKFAVLIALVLLAIALAFGALNKASVASRVQITAIPGTLDWYAQKAQAEGTAGYKFRGGMIEYNQPDSWDQVLSTYSFVVVEVISSRSYATAANYDIDTWYKLKVIETLSQKDVMACDACPTFPVAPDYMLPLQANEILVSKAGGTLDYNGVTLISESTDFPDFLTSQRYLLILKLNASSRVGDIEIGPAGVYKINSAGIMEPLHPAWDPYSNELSGRYSDSIYQLRTVLNPPPPSSCNPVTEQNCYDNGWTWNSHTCRCTNPCTGRPWLCQ